MKTSNKCISCFFRQIDATSSLINLKSTKKKDLFKHLTRKLLNFDFNQPPVVFGKTIYNNISRISGIKDIFALEKIAIEKYLLRFTSSIEQRIKRTSRPLYMSAKMCCAANAIDFGAGKRPNINKILTTITKERLAVDNFNIFEEKLRKAKSVLVIGDNCGEIIFDRFFIVELKKRFRQLQIFYATRSSPIINDVLIADARRVAMHTVARLLSSGCDYPGIIIPKASNLFRGIYRQADIVISKGQGNFESLNDRKKDIFYLFQIKCEPVSDYLSLPVGSILFLYNKAKHRRN
jgi:uncharacterized protein with ATP-grasp and redox domains